MGLACGQLGHYKKAAVFLRKALKLTPQNAEVRYAYAVSLFLSGDKGSAFRQCLVLRSVDRKLAYELYRMIKTHPTPQL